MKSPSQSDDQLNDLNSNADDRVDDMKFSLAYYLSRHHTVSAVIVILATIALFIWSNTSDGAWVSMQVTWPPTNGTNTHLMRLFDDGNDHKKWYNVSSLLTNADSLDHFDQSIPPQWINYIKNQLKNKRIFMFSLVGSVRDFWQSKAYALAVLIAAFSGIWPYIKLILITYCLLIPMKQERREAVLIFLDQMGKFSFIDLFVSLYMIVSFYVEITEQLDGLELTIKVVVEPDRGLNTFLIGTVASMIYSHYFLYLDAIYAKPHIKHLMKQKEKRQQQIQQNQDDDTEHNGNRHEWNMSSRPLFIRYVPLSICGIITRSLILLMVFVTLYGIIYSTFTAPVRYDISGLVGMAVSNPIRAYTPWQIVSQLNSHTDEHTAAPPLSAALFLTAIFFPILLAMIIILIWFLPLKYKYLNYFNILMQVCMAWSALDVFAVASIAASLELQQVSEWIILQNAPKMCAADGYIPNITKDIFGTATSCFTVTGYVVWGIWLVIYCSISLWILFIYTIYQLSKSKNYFNKSINNNIADKTIFFFNH